MRSFSSSGSDLGVCFASDFPDLFISVLHHSCNVFLNHIFNRILFPANGNFPQTFHTDFSHVGYCIERAFYNNTGPFFKVIHTVQADLFDRVKGWYFIVIWGLLLYYFCKFADKGASPVVSIDSSQLSSLVCAHLPNAWSSVFQIDNEERFKVFSKNLTVFYSDW